MLRVGLDAADRLNGLSVTQDLEGEIPGGLVQHVADGRAACRTDRVGWFIQIEGRSPPRRSLLSQRRDVVEDIESAAVRRDGNRIRLHPDVRDRSVRQV